jgi:hypothetical protein
LNEPYFYYSSEAGATVSPFGQSIYCLYSGIPALLDEHARVSADSFAWNIRRIPYFSLLTLASYVIFDHLLAWLLCQIRSLLC